MTTKAPRPLPRRVFWWGLTVVGGVLLGLLIAASVLGWQSHAQVQAWLSDPTETAPGVIWSAPIEVRAGQSATQPELAGDLLAAGYSMLEQMPETPAGTSPVGVFVADGDTLTVWTEAMVGPDLRVEEGLAKVVIRDGRVRSVSPGDEVVLRPTVLATIGDPQTRRTEVDLAELSPWVEKAVVAIEDERFRRHIGIDLHGILRAARTNYEEGETVEGGSTLTQQLAKNLFLTSERTYRRKIREAALALALEFHLTKDQILELYLGELYLGQMGGLPLYGVEAASRAWFGKSPDLLGLHEAALLAGVIAAPNVYSPVRHPERARERRDRVLQRMEELGYASPEEVQEAMDQPLDLRGLEPSLVRRAPYAVDYAVEVAEAELGAGALATRGYQVWTWIQPQLQRTAEKAVQDGLAEVDRIRSRQGEAQAALVAVRNEDGGILAMVGGRSYVDSPYNRAVDARRHAGSTIKPLTLLAALDARAVTLADTLLDAPISRGAGRRSWTPQNYDGGYAGWITVRTAIEHSRNIPAVLLAERVGLGRLQRVWQDAGLSEATPWPSAALGAFGVSPVQMAGAYTVFPNAGVVHRPQIVRVITTADGEEVRRFGSERRRIADAQATALAVSVLEGVIDRGTGARARSFGVKGPVGGKTGTTDRFRDAWFVGFNPEMTVAVWVGRDQGQLGLSGSQGALPTWARFMARAGPAEGDFRVPDGLIWAHVCSESGQLARETCPTTHREQFIRGREPVTPCEMHAPTTDPTLWELIFGSDPGQDTDQDHDEPLDPLLPQDGEPPADEAPAPADTAVPDPGTGDDPDVRPDDAPRRAVPPRSRRAPRPERLQERVPEPETPPTRPPEPRRVRPPADRDRDPELREQPREERIEPREREVQPRRQREVPVEPLEEPERPPRDEERRFDPADTDG